VSVDEIPLPVMTSNIPLPASDLGYNSNELPIGILKKPPLYMLVINYNIHILFTTCFFEKLILSIIYRHKLKIED